MQKKLQLVMMAAVVTLLGGVAGTPLLNAQRGQERGGGMGVVGITLFVDVNYRGANSNFRTEVSDLRKFGLNDRVESLQMGRGEVWEVCEDISFRGRCQVFSGDEPDLNRVSWGGLISSLRPLRDGAGQRGGRGGGFPPPPPMRARLVLFDGIDFRGESVVVTETTPALRLMNNRAASLKVYGGEWQICDGAEFWGHCEMVRQSVPDLARFGFRDRISSIRLRR